MFMAICYAGLCVGTCYLVYNPEKFIKLLLFVFYLNFSDNFYNIGLYSTLIAIGIDFIAFDLFFVLILSILKLKNESLKLFAFGGYISI